MIENSVIDMTMLLILFLMVLFQDQKKNVVNISFSVEQQNTEPVIILTHTHKHTCDA